MQREESQKNYINMMKSRGCQIFEFMILKQTFHGKLWISG